MKKITVAAVSAIVAISASSTFAAGFSLNEVSARGNALQGTLVGSTRDISAVYFNPANLTELDDGGLYTMFGITLARPDYNTKVMGVDTDQDEAIFPLPHIYIGGKIADDFFAGFGVYSEYGLGTRYENRRSWPLAADSSKTSMESFTLSPTVAWQATDKLSLAIGVRAMYLKLISDRMIPAYGSYFHLDVDDWACSYLASAAYQISDTLRFGIVYRGQSDFHEEGDVNLYQLGLKTGVKGDISMPQSVMAGFNWQATEALNIGVNVTYTDWSVFESLDMDFASPAMPDQSVTKSWYNTMRYSIGAEYVIDENWSALCGFTHDIDPTNSGKADTMCPPGDRDQIGLGCTYAKDNWSITLDYMLVIIHETDRKVHGVETQFRDLRTDTLGISYSYKF